MGPEMLPASKYSLYGGRCGEVSRGLRAFSDSLLYCAKTIPCTLSIPGLVKISMRPKPGRSYSGENGFELIRTSRIDDFDGSIPPVNPSIYICPPFGPAPGPAIACNWEASSSGSSLK